MESIFSFGWSVQQYASIGKMQGERGTKFTRGERSKNSCSVQWNKNKTFVGYRYKERFHYCFFLWEPEQRVDSIGHGSVHASVVLSHRMSPKLLEGEYADIYRICYMLKRGGGRALHCTVYNRFPHLSRYRDMLISWELFYVTGRHTHTHPSSLSRASGSRMLVNIGNVFSLLNH